ncbi:hypothetical protein [Allonocardiopsis opalescens]|uniref:Uncharacterized protein n=1 Tax=Allonocardiopsis opalescens TaxID=1144618 RepID=A0A2T0PSZ6_9ACTN|nr:hypothetical protein [Allonocardiopsis opalescens]PRX92031.1 hypothetical protein CLV72_112104 [Allonocardiopsis opalescens]
MGLFSRKTNADRPQTVALRNQYKARVREIEKQIADLDADHARDPSDPQGHHHIRRNLEANLSICKDNVRDLT